MTLSSRIVPENYLLCISASAEGSRAVCDLPQVTELSFTVFNLQVPGLFPQPAPHRELRIGTDVSEFLFAGCQRGSREMGFFPKA